MKKNILAAIITIVFSVINISAYAGSSEEIGVNKKQQIEVTEVKDCFERLNRGIFAFNQGLDKIIFKPLAKGYRVLPQPVRSGTSNVLTNISNVVTIPNNLLQGQIKEAGLNSLRLVINTTFGIFGIFDVASYYEIKKLDKEDYGQTLGSWGFGEGCYLVLPVLGHLQSELNWLGSKFCRG